MKKYLTIVFVCIVSTAFSQKNLVPNHNFQEISGKVKDNGAIKSATSWTSPTLA